MVWRRRRAVRRAGVTSNEIKGMKSFVTSFRLLLSLSSCLGRYIPFVAIVIYSVDKNPFTLSTRIHCDCYFLESTHLCIAQSNTNLFIFFNDNYLCICARLWN